MVKRYVMWNENGDWVGGLVDMEDKFAADEAQAHAQSHFEKAMKEMVYEDGPVNEFGGFITREDKEMVMSGQKEGTQVQVQLERMDMAIKRGWEAVEQLEATLGPILRDEAATKDVDAAAINLVDHAAKLENFSDLIERLADKIVELRQRCEL